MNEIPADPHSDGENPAGIQVEPDSGASVERAGARSTKVAWLPSVAFSMLLSVFFVATLALHHDSLERQTLIWVLYVTICGACIQPQKNMPWMLVWATMPAALTFLACAAFLTWLSAVAGIAFTFTGGGTYHADEVAQKISVYSVVAVPTWLMIIVGSVGRSYILELYAKSKEVTVTELKSLEQKISACALIAGTLLSFSLSVLAPGMLKK